jgi:hypothetical protein
MFRQRIFMPDGMDSDQHITGYKWLDEDVERLHPPYYFLTHCPECHYTDSVEEFAKPASNPFNQLTIKAYRRNGASSVLIHLLGQCVKQENIDYESALNLHYLAIAICLLPSEDSHDSLKLARLYLRLAWLYREGDMRASAAKPSAPENGKNGSSETGTETAARLLSSIQTIEMEIQKLHNKWQGAQVLLRRRILEVARLGSNPYPSCFAALNEAFEKQTTMIAQMKDICLRDAHGILFHAPPQEDKQETNGHISALAGKFDSYEAFFAKLKELWPEAPSNEDESMKCAVTYFKRALSEDSRLSGLQNYLMFSNLLVDLMQRLGDMKGAFEIARSIYMAAVSERQTLQTKMREGGLSDDEKRLAEGAFRRAIQATEEAAELRRQLTETVIEREWPTIKATIQRFAPNEDAVEKALSEQGFPQEVTKELRSSGRMKTA